MGLKSWYNGFLGWVGVISLVMCCAGFYVFVKYLHFLHIKVFIKAKKHSEGIIVMAKVKA